MHDCILCLISLNSVQVCWKELLLFRASLGVESEVMSLTKGGRLCSQSEVGVKVVFVRYMLAPPRPGLGKTSSFD